MAKHKLRVKLVISGYVHELIRKLHQEYPSAERSWIARIEKKDGYYLMSDIRFPKQSNHWAETEMKDWWLEALLEDIFTQSPEQLHEWKCWIHSHHHMWCFWSGTDEAAKRSFNDWATDFRWSVVTAYDKNWPTYKCALNVFKPVNMEFNIPVGNEEFDITEYMRTFWLDYASYERKLKDLEYEYNWGLANLNQTYIPTEADIDSLVQIFNVEWTPEDREVIINLITKDYQSSKKDRKRRLDERYEEAVSDLQEEYQLDFFSDKIKELKDNIIPPILYRAEPRMWWYSQTRWLFDQNDTKYVNHTAPKQWPLSDYLWNDRD